MREWMKTRSVWNEASKKLAWSVHMKEPQPGKIFSRPHEKEQLCVRCINREWAPPQRLLWNYVLGNSSFCTMCGCKIEPGEAMKKQIKKRRASGALGQISRRDDAEWRRRVSLAERQRYLGDPRTVTEILSRVPRDDDPDT